MIYILKPKKIVKIPVDHKQIWMFVYNIYIKKYNGKTTFTKTTYE